MFTRTHRDDVVFKHSFLLKGVDRPLPPGHYQVVTDEQLIEELSFPVYRRTSTMMQVPAQSHHASAIEFVVIGPLDLRAAQERDSTISALQERETAPVPGTLASERDPAPARGPNSASDPKTWWGAVTKQLQTILSGGSASRSG